MDQVLEKLRISEDDLDAVNSVLLNGNLKAIRELADVVAKYGTPEQINRRARLAGQQSNLMQCVMQRRPEYIPDLDELIEKRDRGAFIGIEAYRRKVLGDRLEETSFNDDLSVTLEISSVSYFSWLMQMARRAVERGELMPARIIRVRIMEEQEADGDLPACLAACQIIGASQVEQPDTRGADGSNIHLGGADTLVGYFGGVGQPNDYPLRWVDECLYYYTTYGVGQVLNLNAGTILVGYLLFRLGIDLKFKISVTLGNDNPYSALWTLMAARLFTRPDGTTPLEGFNWSNSVTVQTIEKAAELRRALGLERLVRFEHHVTETYKGVVIQPYDRREDILRLAERVQNISAKHEGGDPQIEKDRQRPSDMFDYYKTKEEIEAAGIWDTMTENFMDKFSAMNRTARELTERGLSVAAARNLHR